MPEQSLQEIEEQIQEAEDDIRTVRGEQQLKALKKQKKRKLRKKQTEAKLKQTKTGRVISNLSQEIGQLFEQTERLDADGKNDASKEILIEAGTATKDDGDEDPADAITGEVEIEGTLDIEDADIETRGTQPEPEPEPLGAGGLPPAMEQTGSENNDDNDDERGPTGLPRSGFL